MQPSACRARAAASARPKARSTRSTWRPLHQGVGLGEHLFEGCRHMLEMRGHAGLIVWSLADNHGALDFYWRRGGRPLAETTELIGGAKLKKIAFEWA